MTHAESGQGGRGKRDKMNNNLATETRGGNEKCRCVYFPESHFARFLIMCVQGGVRCTGQQKTGVPNNGGILFHHS